MLKAGHSAFIAYVKAMDFYNTSKSTLFGA